MKKIQLRFIGYPIYRWMWRDRYISRFTAWILIDILRIADAI